MKTKIYIFDDSKFEEFYPLTLSRPLSSIRVGTMSAYRRWQKIYPAYDIAIITKPSFKEILYEKYVTDINEVDENCEKSLFINARVISGEQIPVAGPDEIGVQGSSVTYLRIDTSRVKDLSVFSSKRIMEEVKGWGNAVKTNFDVLENLWDIIKINADRILRDYNQFYEKSELKSKGYINLATVGEDFIHVDKGVDIGPNCVIDASSGPVIILEGTQVGAFSYIKGPVFIDKDCQIKPHAQIFSGTSIYYQCKIGGEVNNTIFHSYSNKVHHGFIGHSYVGKWVNIGAGTSNSNLKNNYSYINIEPDGKKSVRTDTMFLGAFIGDFTKFSINCSINSGSIFGFCSNVFQSGTLLPKFVGNFKWGLDSSYSLGKAKEAAEKMMKRRGAKFTPALEKLFGDIFSQHS